jgi:SAM-dependent methyltransferase
VVVCDDASADTTYLVSLDYQTAGDLPLISLRNAHNLGYGGNQKTAYRWAIERGLDIVVLLHGDGQYAPEVIEDLIAPLMANQCDATLGSRMLAPGSARMGGMPLYKYAGNRILTKLSNAMVGTSLSEWHSGYRAYRIDALRDIPFEADSDGFDFDTQIIVQLHEAGKKIIEVPIPTFYGDEICYVNGLRYARDVTADVVRYRLHKTGFGSGELAFTHNGYDLKLSPFSSHGQLVSWLANRPPGRVLDLGCSDGRLGALFRLSGHSVVGVDSVKHNGVGARLDEFVEADLNQGLPTEVGKDFDVVVAADVLEHTMNPGSLLAELRDVLSPGGVVLVSVPNVAHWYPRVRVLLGRFDYDSRGIFDEGHLRFFTRRSFERLIQKASMQVRRSSTVGIPVEVADRGGAAPGWAKELVGRLDRAGVALWPNLFAYQYIFELEAAPKPPSRLRQRPLDRASA